MGGWPPDPAWMREGAVARRRAWLYRCCCLLSQSAPVCKQEHQEQRVARRLCKERELNRRLVSLREILEEEKMRVERKKLKEAKAAEADKDGVQTGDASNTVSEPALNEDSTISVLEHESTKH